MAQATVPTRYERVKAILDQTLGTGRVDYGGAGRFWDLPLEQFLEVRVYGVRMIAPASRTPPPSGRGHAEAGSARPAAEESQPPFPGRGEASGLVKGLRGVAPFDGTQFPRMPWGGNPVDEADIQFISDWIDDGCPEPDRELEAVPPSPFAAKL